MPHKSSNRLLVANRGEIVCRIARTAQRLGWTTIAVYSDADRGARHVRVADEAYHLGASPAAQSYLNGTRVLELAHRVGADAVHPGYGFLSENADFAQACVDAGLTFIGPPAAAIRSMGSKSASKAAMAAVGVPVAPGYHGSEQSLERLQAEAVRVGFPLIVKASAGGGGKGMQVVHSAADVAAAIGSAQRLARTAFGDDRLLLERYFAKARHVEVQVFADSHGEIVALFDRDCSVQRRHQKIIEEAPAPGLSDDLRRRMSEAATAAARTIFYIGAGTVEFLVPASGDAFYFMEMNTRLQVEHPVTEMICGLDLVEWQIRVAAGQALPLAQGQISITGHAIEARIYAEDPERDFLPQAGRIERLDFPDPGPHVRIDAGVAAHGEVDVHYDPMIAKLIVWDEDRPAAIRRLSGALGDTRIVGLSTNVEFLRRVAAHEAYRDATLDTGFIERYRSDLLAPAFPASNEILAMAAIGLFRARADVERAEARHSHDPWSPWSRQDGWRLNELAQERLVLREIGPPAQVDLAIEVTYLRDGWRLDLPKGACFFHARGALAEDGALSVDLDGKRLTAVWVRSRGEVSVFSKGQPTRRFALVDPVADAARRSEPHGGLVSPMPGRIIALLVEPGARVEANQPVLIIEAMKMEHQLRAATSGIVKAFKFRIGDQAPEGVELVSFEAEEP